MGSFVQGAKKVASGTEPKVVVLSGSQYELKKLLLENFYARENVEVVHSSKREDAFVSAYRVSHSRVVVYSEQASVAVVGDGKWLPQWLSKSKAITLVFCVNNQFIAERLKTVVHGKGLYVDCEAPTGPASQDKLVTLLAERYAQSPTQIRILLNKFDWTVDPCVQLLKKLHLLSLPLTNDAVSTVGIHAHPQDDFIHAMQLGKVSEAMALIPMLQVSDYRQIVERLSEWLNLIARIKAYSGAYKSSSDIASQAGTDKAAVEKFLKIARNFDVNRINRAALALAEADSHLSKGYTDAVLELMVNNW